MFKRILIIIFPCHEDMTVLVGGECSAFAFVYCIQCVILVLMLCLCIVNRVFIGDFKWGFYFEGV